MAQQTSVDRAAANAASIRRGYDAFARADLAGATSDFGPGIEWHLYGTGRIAGTYRGIGDVTEFLRQLAILSGGTFRMEVLDILASEQEAMANVHVSAERLDRTYSSHQVHLFRYQGAQVVEVWQFVSDTEASAAFWA